MFLFKDSRIGQELALFIYKEKDNKDAKATTLIVRPPTTERFSRRWRYNFYPLNLSRWQQVIASDHGSVLKTTILLALHHKNFANS